MHARSLGAYAWVIPIGLAGSGAAAQSDLRQATAIAGTTPTAMAACGLSAPQVGIFFDAVRGSAEQAALLGARTAVIAAEQNLRAVVRSTDLTQAADAAAVAQAWAEASAAKALLESATAAFLFRATQDLPAAARQRLVTWRSAPLALAPEFSVVVWTSAETKSLQAALLAERLAAAAHRPVATESATLLAQARSRPEVAQATVNLGSVLAAIATAFENAVQ